MEYVWVFVFGFIAVYIILLLLCRPSNYTMKNSYSCDNSGKECKTNKKTFPSMKKGSRFYIDGRVAEKTSDTMYRIVDTNESLYWLNNHMLYYHMLYEPSHSYEAVDKNDKTETYDSPTPSYHHYSSPSYSSSNHSSCGGSSSHSSCSSSSSSCSSSSCGGGGGCSSCGGGD